MGLFSSKVEEPPTQKKSAHDNCTCSKFLEYDPQTHQTPSVSSSRRANSNTSELSSYDLSRHRQIQTEQTRSQYQTSLSRSQTQTIQDPSQYRSEFSQPRQQEERLRRSHQQASLIQPQRTQTTRNTSTLSSREFPTLQSQGSQSTSIQQKSFGLQPLKTQTSRNTTTALSHREFPTLSSQGSQSSYHQRITQVVQSKTTISQSKYNQTSLKSKPKKSKSSKFTPLTLDAFSPPPADSDEDNEENCYEHNAKAYRGENRCYGYFYCFECGRTWESGNSWFQYQQRCQSCNQWIMADCYHALEVSDNNSDPNKPHQQNNCKKCIELGRRCFA